MNGNDEGKARRRAPSDEERALFEHAMRQVRRRHAQRLREETASAALTATPETPKAEAPPAKEARRPPAAKPACKPPPPPAENAPPRRAGLDKATARRLSRGQIPIEAVLDLHGHRQETAHRELNGFVRAAHAAGRRCVLVITGRGKPRFDRTALTGISIEEGVLRRNVPRWLAEPPLRELVLATRRAQPQHGGGGALYVLLRRRRG